MGPLEFPAVFKEYGLVEELLISVFEPYMDKMAVIPRCHDSKTCHSQVTQVWHLESIPTIGFYKGLHSYLRENFIENFIAASKTAIGNFYLWIDSNFITVKGGGQPDNIYRFIDRIAKSKHLPSNKPMVYYQ